MSLFVPLVNEVSNMLLFLFQSEYGSVFIKRIQRSSNKLLTFIFKFLIIRSSGHNFFYNGILFYSRKSTIYFVHLLLIEFIKNL